MALVPGKRKQEEVDDDQGVDVFRGSGFGRAKTGGRVRSRRQRRPSQPAGPKRREAASPDRQRTAARNLVTGIDKPSFLNPQPPRDFAGDENALLQTPIAGLSDAAVNQVGEGRLNAARTPEEQRGLKNAAKGSGFQHVTDPATGHTVPNQGDRVTKEAFRRFFDTSFRPGVNSQTPSQRDRDADPTRAAFQNKFFPSETLGDVGVGKQRRFRV